MIFDIVSFCKRNFKPDDFIENSDRKIFDALEKHSQKITNGIPEKTLPATCPECQHSYTTPFTFDYANFFGTAS